MCGIIGVVARVGEAAAPIIYDGLTVLQHRGQDAAGIVTCEGEQLYQRKSNGLVRDVFKQHHMNTLAGHMGVGHVRYPTAGSSSCAEAQPFYTNSPYGISLAHNGNLTNSAELAHQLYVEDLRHVNTTSDSEVLMNIFAHELQKRGKLSIESNLYLDVKDVFHAVKRVHERCRGGYAIISMITGYGLLGFRDPQGIRPLILGRREGPDGGDEWLLASESVALISLGVEVVRVRKIMQTIGCVGMAASLLIVGEVESAWRAIGVMSIGTFLGAFVTGGFAANHMDIAPRHAGTLMGITNTAGTIPGIVGVYASGMILQATGSWAMVFQVAAGITLVGLVFFLLFASGRREFD